ncbi:kinase-like domain-containing protein, partial [Lasiosphaeris hirsuta]
PHKLAIFTLYPLNPLASNSVHDPVNEPLTSVGPDGKVGIDVGINIRTRTHQTLETLGRDGGIFIDCPSVSKIQCSFEIDDDSKAILLCDRSFHATTQVFGSEGAALFPLERDCRPRQVVVAPNVNVVIGMGGTYRDLVKFKLVWWDRDPKKLEDSPLVPPNPKLARTLGAAETEQPSRRETRTHTPATGTSLIRYFIKDSVPLGEGKSGKVYKAINVDSGKHMAVKIIQIPRQATESERSALRLAVKTEVEMLERLDHVHIVELFGHNRAIGQYELFTGLLEGSLRTLFTALKALPDPVIEDILKQSLQGLDYLAHHGLVHRDIKPENILYRPVEGPQGQTSYHVEICDLELCDNAFRIHGRAGTIVYMAPEVVRMEKSTPKSDIYSLYMTMFWVRDTNGFRNREPLFEDYDQILDVVFASLSSDDWIKGLRVMGEMNPDHRASAAQMLVTRFNGEGLSTPINRIPPI